MCRKRSVYMCSTGGTALLRCATWIGQATALANDFPDPAGDEDRRRSHFRDNEGQRVRGTGRAKHPGTGTEDSLPLAPPVNCDGGFPGHAQWQALHERIVAKQAAAAEDSPNAHANGLAAALLAPEEGSISMAQQNRRRVKLRCSYTRSARGSLPEAVALPTIPLHHPQGSREAAAGWARTVRTAQQRLVTPSNALKDLAELHGDGLRVRWPKAALGRSAHCWPVCSTSGGAEAIAKAAIRQGQQAAPSRGVQEASEADAAALDDLRDLHKSGVPVWWPT